MQHFFRAFLTLLFLIGTNFGLHAQDGTILPRPEPEFKGKITPNVKNSVPDFPEPYRAKDGAPNILLIMTDDVGFSASSTFGGAIPTPTFDRLASQGLRYNCFHTTGICSPTRAALLTGRNHHSASTGNIMEFATGYPGYDTLMSKGCGTLGEMLKQNGYSTSWFGKNHNVPDWQGSAMGPFDLWPTGLGFEYFYGFIAAEMDQWNPLFFEGTTPLEKSPEQKELHFDQMMADKAIDWIRLQHALTPDKPFFAYYTPGTAHTPHHAPKEWLEKMRGKFDQGWDKVREETLERQIKAGIVPPGTKLTPRPKEIPAWDGLSADQKLLYCRLMEAYAAALAHCDYQIGRVIRAVEETGKLDNTIIIYIQGDNGPSGEGGLGGKSDEGADGVTADTLEYLMSRMDEFGGPTIRTHYPVGWAHAMATPMQWTKQISSHFGGTRNGMVIHWPKGIRAKGEVRSQFHHVIDIVPTLLEAAGVVQPEMIGGVRQKPIEGVTMSYSFEKPKTPSTHKTQYFEMISNRALYHDGWMASTTPLRLPWVYTEDPDPDAFPWELYHVAEDFSQANNLAEKHPEKLEELKKMFDAEAKKYDVYPLDASFVGRVDPGKRPSLTGDRKSFTYYQGMKRITEGAAPNMKNRSYSITADFDVPANGKTDGVLATIGGSSAGWVMMIWQGKPTFVYSSSNKPRFHTWFTGDKPIEPGKHTLRFEFKYDGGGAGKGALGSLILDGTKIAEKRIEYTIPLRFSMFETFDIGLDLCTPVVPDYFDLMPFKYPDKIDKVVIDLE